jgi:multidrug efflux system outer membrane protein
MGTLPAGPAAGAEKAGPGWWESFHDPVLTGLVVRALGANRDLQAADAQLREARALWLAADADRSPAVRAEAEYRRQHEPPDEKNKDALVDQFFVSGFAASWEADLFGRIRSLAAAAHASAEAQAAARSDLALALAAEVGRNYFGLRAQQWARSGLRHAIESRTVELDLNLRRAALGTANRRDLAAARQNLAREQGERGDVEAAISRTIQRLSVLTAQPAEVLLPVLEAPTSLGDEPAEPALGTPAELLRRRPDIRQAEEELVASSATADAARADLLPRLTFDGQLSFFAFGWGVGPHLTWDVFDRRRVKAREAQATARADAAFARYQQTVLTAVEDVENALANLQAAGNRRNALQEAAEQASGPAASARRRADLGVSNRLELVAAERADADAASVLAMQEAVVREAWVAVFKALGGGWDASDAGAAAGR